MIRNHASFKYKTPFKGLFEMVQTWKNRTFTLQTGAITTRINISRINPYFNIKDAD